MSIASRAIVLSLPRFVIIIGLLAILRDVDFSPLPVWSAPVIAYILHFYVTYLFARWVFQKRSPHVSNAFTVSILFIVLEIVLEVGLTVLAGQGEFFDLLTHYEWQSLYIILLYVLATSLAAYHAKRKFVQASLPEGLES